MSPTGATGATVRAQTHGCAPGFPVGRTPEPLGFLLLGKACGRWQSAWPTSTRRPGRNRRTSRTGQRVGASGPRCGCSAPGTHGLSQTGRGGCAGPRRRRSEDAGPRPAPRLGAGAEPLACPPQGEGGPAQPPRPAPRPVRQREGHEERAAADPRAAPPPGQRH